MIGQGALDPIDIEILNRHAKVGDRRLGVGAALRQADVLRAWPDAKPHGNSLAVLHRQPEQALVELDGALAV